MTARYWMLSGAVAAWRFRELHGLLRARDQDRILCVPTPNAPRVLAPRELARLDGVRVIESYFDEALAPRAPLLDALWAPCSFNSLNKLAHGIADSLALSIAAEMIGARMRVVVALALNAPLWAHPQARESVARLCAWGVGVIDPREGEHGFGMAPADDIAAALV